MRSFFTQSGQPRRRAEPWTAASMSSLRKGGKRVATSAERLPPCRSFPPSSTQSHPHPSLPPVGSPTAAALPRSSRSEHRAAWIGTRFLASNEAAIHPRYRERLVKATENDTAFLEELFDVGWPKAPHRVLRNKTVAAWEAAGRPPFGKRPGEG